jgi:hypothetical protein
MTGKAFCDAKEKSKRFNCDKHDLMDNSKRLKLMAAFFFFSVSKCVVSFVRMYCKEKCKSISLFIEHVIGRRYKRVEI